MIKCRKLGISLNPKKTFFFLKEGKLLGNIISKYGFIIDPKRIEPILKISPPRKIKELQSFIGKIIFLRIFFPNLTELIRKITNMLKKDFEIKWSIEARKYFDMVKHALTKAPVLISPDFTKYFIIFSLASEHTVTTILL